ncbi:MAG: Cysteine-tRNA ligase [Candidatus Gottesmanbacteria bacterium GW2011_GWC2_39_8]|uniref:Cysteine--tRNA ligase n=1 Tax=Candidatus Gottesmanbacteria bacterium GW2011_GWC2_39_8 TaxID=1618450 RepID=A0A0G0QA79_9BACT|nr:MAG: Cysteine-tRNA ligase [Candidatus Gottesmanbacteria bacterium GW2011_GWC2_39_8]
MLKIYNTLTRSIEDFKPVDSKLVTFYSCGPTVYDYPHIGNFRTFVFDDILRRVLKYNGFPVKQVMNITDVGHLVSDEDTGEDKMEKGAKREGKSAWEIAKFYTDYFLKSLAKLNIETPDVMPRATETITQQSALIKKLEEKGFTYKIDDGIYFDTLKFPEYGILTGQKWGELQKTLAAGKRVEMVSGKKNITDFALWKFSPKGTKRQMEWDSPWGKGFPGWHLECSAMSLEFLLNAFDGGKLDITKVKTIDLHTGGVDHIQVHHTNEIAQSEVATGVKFVNYWMHGEFLLIHAEKISKSLRNFILIEDLEEKGFTALDLRYFFFTALYRQKLNFSWDNLSAAKNALNNLKQQIISFKNDKVRTSLSEEKMEKIDVYKDKFKEAINHDLNIPQALSVVWEVVKSNIPGQDKYDLIMDFDEVLGLGLSEVSEEIIQVPDEVNNMVKEREEMRKSKNFEASDILRNKINASGYEIEDTSTGTKITKK